MILREQPIQLDSWEKLENEGIPMTLDGFVDDDFFKSEKQYIY